MTPAVRGSPRPEPAPNAPSRSQGEQRSGGLGEVRRGIGLRGLWLSRGGVLRGRPILAALGLGFALLLLGEFLLALLKAVVGLWHLISDRRGNNRLKDNLVAGGAQSRGARLEKEGHYRIACRLRAGAAAIKPDRLPSKRPPRRPAAAGQAANGSQGRSSGRTQRLGIALSGEKALGKSTRSSSSPGRCVTSSSSASRLSMSSGARNGPRFERRRRYSAGMSRT